MGISLNRSWMGFDWWTWLKGSKRGLVAIVSGALMYWFTDEATTSLIAGAIIERLFAVGDFYFSQVKI